MHDITANNQISLTGKRILVVGAGGAVRGILQPFLAENPKSITIVNRTFEKAEALAENFSGMGNINAQTFEALDDAYDVIINGTSASLSGDLPPLSPLVVAGNSVVYDMMYAKQPTVFMDWAKSHGAGTVIDGLGMLVGQAAVSFDLWRGYKPEIASVLTSMRAQLV